MTARDVCPERQPLTNPMAKYFRIDSDGTKRGPFDKEQIKQLLRYKHISPTTLLETEDGVQISAGEIPNLFDSQSTMASTSLSESAIPDIGFSEFFTPILITITWWLAVISTIGSCSYVMYLTSSSNTATEGRIVALVTIAISVLSLLYTRILLELTAIFFRMERHQRTIKEILERNEQAAKP